MGGKKSNKKPTNTTTTTKKPTTNTNGEKPLSIQQQQKLKQQLEQLQKLQPHNNNNNNKDKDKQMTIKLPKLLDDEDDFFIEKAEKALREIFSRYDLDKDGLLGIDELNQFAIKCNGKPFDQDSIDSILEAFECEQGKLTIRGFLEMYYMQSISEPEETWRDISAHGYNSDYELQTDSTTTTTTTTTPVITETSDSTTDTSKESTV